jgi:para-aminobenzoate synthetase component 1
VAQAKRAIGQGAYYQVNLTGAFSWQLSHHLSPWALFWLLYERFPAAAAGGFALENGLWISLSPETLVRRRNSMVWTEPIKGTRPLNQGSSAEAAELASSEKERAELSMIVDLLRNDFAEVCLPGSVCVTHHLETFSVGRLWQMFSRISGQLLPDLGDERLLWSLFPPGSVTGCPKRAALLAIDTLENYPRGYYCGSMISRPYPNHLDASVSIRSGFATKTTFQYYAGSGIVMDSDPEEEYRETLSKASHIALALEGRIPW